MLFIERLGCAEAAAAPLAAAPVRGDLSAAAAARADAARGGVPALEPCCCAAAAFRLGSGGRRGCARAVRGCCIAPRRRLQRLGELLCGQHSALYLQLVKEASVAPKRDHVAAAPRTGPPLWALFMVRTNFLAIYL